MLHEDQCMERTPDFVAKVRTLREAAEKEMNHFTCVADYDVRRVIGEKPKAEPVSGEPALSSPVMERAKKPTAKPLPSQISIEFAPAPGEQGDAGEPS